MKYQAYPEYKDSGVEWLGDVPEHWKTPCLRWYINIASGEGLSNTDFDKVYDGVNRFRVIGGNGTLGYSAQFNTSSKAFAIGRVGALCGNIHFINEICWITDNALKLSAWVELHDHYFFFLLKAAKLNEYASITAQPLITGEQVKALRIVIPPIREQQNIANFLDHETAKIDTLIEKQQQLIKLLKEKRQAVISHAVTKGLNPNAPMRESGVEWLGDVPEHWNVYKLKHIITSLESGVSVNAADIPAYGDGLGVLKTSCVYTRSFRVEENKTVLKEEENRVKCPIRKGAIIISRMNTPDLVGASALVEVDDTNIYLPDRLWQTIFASNIKLNPKFISFFMMIKGFRNQISLAAEGASSSMQNIAKDDYLSINITLPDIAEQDVIVSHLENKLGYFQKLEERANKAIELIQERRTALISAAVTGKIDVRSWQAPEPLHSNKETYKEEIA